MFDVAFDDGDYLEDIPESFVFHNDDYILSVKNFEEKNSWIGVSNVVDDNSKDRWARIVGWYNVNIGEHDVGLTCSFCHARGYCFSPSIFLSHLSVVKMARSTHSLVYLMR